MGGNYRGSPPPDGPGKPVYDVIAPRPGESYDLTILDGMILGTECHWVVDATTRQGRSRLCLNFSGDCPHCKTERKLWLGWLACLDNGRRSRVILRLGRESAVVLSSRAEPFAGLRGQRFDVKRSRDTRTGSLIYEPSLKSVTLPIPEAHNMDATLCLVLGCSELPEYRFTAKDLKGERA